MSKSSKAKTADSKPKETANKNPADAPAVKEGTDVGKAQADAMNEQQTIGTAPSNPAPGGGEALGGVNDNPSIGETVAGMDKPPVDPNAPPNGANLSTVMPNAPVPRLSPKAAFPDEDTKTMISPVEFKVQYKPGMFAHFKKGPQEVPTSLQEHPYVLAHKVEPYEKV